MRSRRSPLERLVRQARTVVGPRFRPEDYSLELGAVLERSGRYGPFRVALANRIEHGRATGTQYVIVCRNGAIVWRVPVSGHEGQSAAVAAAGWLNDRRVP